MQVLQICAYGSPTSGNFISTLFALESKLKEKNIETIYAFPEKARNTEWCVLLQQRAKVYFLPEAKARILPKTYSLIKKIFDENEIVIAHSHFELYDIPTALMAPKNVKVFWHLHDAIKHGYENGTFLRRCLTKLQYGIFSKRATLLSVSKEHMEFVLSLGFNPQKAYYLPNGISTSRISTDSVFSSDNNFLMFGWDYFRKGVDLAAEAMKKLGNSDVCIYVVGEDFCKQKLSEFEHPGVSFANKSDNVNNLYSKSKAFVHISRAEGLSYALLEAIYYGLPIICSDIPENLFAKEFSGVTFVHNEDVDDIARGLSEVAQSSGLTDEEIKANREIIMQKYSLDAWCDNVLSLYDIS